MNPIMAADDAAFSYAGIIGSGISFFSLVVSFVTYFYVKRQVALLRSQIQIDVGFKISAVNRELLAMAFHDVELFSLFDDKPFTAHKQKHYIQMWLNHIDSMWRANEHGLIETSEWYAMKKDIADFFAIRLVKEHWNSVKSFYTPEFVQFISSIPSANLDQ